MTMSITEYGSNDAMDHILPNATNVYIGLFTVLPTARAGTGGTEATGSGYARIAHAAWTTAHDASGRVTYRKNNGAITLAALSGNLSNVVGWGIWDALTVGNLIAFGTLQDSGGTDIVRNFISGDQPRFLDTELQVGIGDE